VGARGSTVAGTSCWNGDKVRVRCINPHVLTKEDANKEAVLKDDFLEKNAYGYGQSWTHSMNFHKTYLKNKRKTW